MGRTAGRSAATLMLLLLALIDGWAQGPAAHADLSEQLLVEAPPDEPRGDVVRVPEIGGEVWAGPGARQVLWAAKRQGKWHMVVNGEAGPAWEEIGAPFFSVGGEHMAYAARREGRHWVVVLDGQPLPGDFSDVGTEFAFNLPMVYLSSIPVILRYHKRLVFSPDGKRLGFIAWQGKQRQVVVDGKPGPLYEDIAGLRFSADGRRVGYVAKRRKEWVLVIDDKEIGPGLKDIASQFAFTSDGQHVLHLGKPEGEWLLYRDGQPQRSSCALLNAPAFSADGTRLACDGKRGRDVHVFVDEEPGPALRDVLAGPIFSPDSRHVAYVATSKGSAELLHVVDGASKPVDLGEGFLANHVNRILFSPDSAHVAYVVGRHGMWVSRRATRHVVVDGKGLPSLNAEINNLVFSQDGRHIAYEAHDVGDHKSAVVLDGQLGKTYDEIVWDSASFAAEDELVYVGRIGRKFYRVVQKLPK